MRKIAKTLQLAGVLTVTLAMIAGCSASPETAKSDPVQTGASNEIDSLVAAAKKEGSVTFYTTATAGPAQLQADAFTAKYGIPTSMVRLTGSQMDQRFQAEVDSAGGTPADIMFTTNPVLIKSMVEKGALVALKDADLPGFPGEFPERFLLSDVGSAVTLIQPAAIAYNTDLVKGKDIPTGWADLLDPKWNGKIGIASPTSALGYVGEWVAVGDMEGDDFLSKLGTQNLKVYAAGATLTGALGAGEIAIAGMSLVTNTVPDMKKGAPIDYVIPDNTSGIQLSVGIVATAKHPNAARLFALYSMSKEGAKVLADAANSVSPYDTKNLPKNYVGADIAGAPGKLAEVQRLLQVK